MSTEKKKIPSYQWPRNEKRPHMRPWYVIAWVALWIPLYYAGLLLSACAIMGCGMGLKDATSFWRDNA